MQNRKIIVLGLGNTLLSDDGIGIYVSREIGKQISDPDITVTDAAIGGLELLDYLSEYDHAILVDAMQTGSYDPGTLLIFKTEDLGGGSAMSRHQVSLAHALELGRRLNMDLPGSIKIYGIEVIDTKTFRESCTEPLQALLPEIVGEIIKQENLNSK